MSNEMFSRCGEGMGRVGHAIDHTVVARKSLRSKPLIAQSTPAQAKVVSVANLW